MCVHVSIYIYVYTSEVISSGGGRVAFIDIPPVGLGGHIMSISGRLTGIGMDGTRPFAEQAESLRPGGVLEAQPFRLAEDELLRGKLLVEVESRGTSGE